VEQDSGSGETEVEMDLKQGSEDMR
jgi:hypothetical protein